MAGEIEARLAYLALSELRRRRAVDTDGLAPGPRGPVDLRTAELKVFSQNGEDGVLWEMIGALEITTEFFVEFGVGDGSECNTRLLADVLGWSGVMFELDRREFDTVESRWRARSDITTRNTSVTPENVNQLFDECGVPSDFGVLSIDVDGQDYWIWKALSNDYRPAIVIIEYNASHGAERSVVEEPGLPWSLDYSDTFGASIEAIRRLGRTKGYELVHLEMAGVNAFLVREDLLARVDLRGTVQRGPNYGLRGGRHPGSPVRPTVET